MGFWRTCSGHNYHHRIPLHQRQYSSSRSRAARDFASEGSFVGASCRRNTLASRRLLVVEIPTDVIDSRCCAWCVVHRCERPITGTELDGAGVTCCHSIVAVEHSPEGLALASSCNRPMDRCCTGCRHGLPGNYSTIRCSAKREYTRVAIHSAQHRCHKGSYGNLRCSPSGHNIQLN